MATAAAVQSTASGGYDALERCVMARDQVAASAAYYDLRRAARPLTEMLREAVRIHGPYTHVPYHERIDDGYVNFVNNDHCLLSARATLHLTDMVAPDLAGLPMAQTVWYIPTGLDIWNQKLIKAPGHYARGYEMPPGPPPEPVVHWPDQDPIHLDGSLHDKLEHWVTLVHRGQVLEAYRVFLGVMAAPANRKQALAALVFAGLMDIQDRVYLNRSYTTGHKAYRARSTAELGAAIGWDDAHDVLYAGALDIAVGPRWYSTYEQACNAIKVLIDDEVLKAVPYAGASDREREMWDNQAPLDTVEVNETVEALIRAPEPAGHEQIAKLLNAGKAPRAILETIQIAAATVLLETRVDVNFSIPQHCYEYCNTVGWFLDNFDHAQKLKLLFTAASFLGRNAEQQRQAGDVTPLSVAAPAGATGMTLDAMLAELDRALITLDVEASLAWARACLDDGGDRAALGRTVAGAAAKIGNDPHNQEIAQCFLEDFARSEAADKELLFLGAVHHTACHRKYGDYLECYHRYCDAFGVTPTV